MSDMDSGTAMQLTAFAHIRRLLELRDALTASDLKPGFQFWRARIPLINPQRIRFATGSRNGIERPPRDSVRRIRVTPLIRRCPTMRDVLARTANHLGTRMPSMS